MDARLALTAAIVCGTLAVSAVAVDLAFTLGASLDTRDEDGAWVTVASAPHGDRYAEPMPHYGCAGPELRLRIDNDRPIGATRDVHVSYHNASAQRTTVLVDERVRIEAMEEKVYTFTIPTAAFPDDNESRERYPFPEGPSTTVFVRLDGIDLSTCVVPAAPESSKGVPA